MQNRGVACDPRGQCRHHLAQSALQRAKQRQTFGLRLVGFQLGQNALGEASVFGFQLHEPRQHARDAERAGTAPVNAREQRLGQVVHRFGAVVRRNELGHRLIFHAAARRVEQFHAHAHLGGPAQQPRGQQRDQLGGHHKLQAVRQRHQPPTLPNVGHAQVIVRADHLVRQSQLADQVHGRRLHGKEAVGAGLDHAAIHALSLNHAAQPRARFDERGGNAGLGQVISGG